MENRGCSDNADGSTNVTVGCNNEGRWVKYSVTFAYSGTYNVTSYMASPSDGTHTMELRLNASDGKVVIESVELAYESFTVTRG